MICTCTHCQARYQLEADKVPQRIIKVRCPACSGVFSLDGTQPEKQAATPAFADSFETSASPFQAPDESGSSGPVAEQSVVQADPFAAPEAAPEAAPPAAPEPGTVSFDDAPPAITADAPEQPAAAAPRTQFDIPETPGEYEIPSDDALSGEDNPNDSFASPAEPVVPQAPEPAAEVETSQAAATVATMGDTPKASKRRRRCKEEMLARALVSDILVYNRETRDSALAEGNLLEALGGEIKKSWELYKEKVTPEVANSTTYFREALNEILAEGDSVF